MIVLDASVWVSRLVPQDVHHLASRLWLEQYIVSGGRLCVPALFLAEVTGAISRQTGQAELAHRAIEHLFRLRAVRVVPLDRQLGRISAGLAADLRLRGADATYVAIAQQLGISLVTWDDGQLSRAGQAIRVYTPDMYPAGRDGPGIGLHDQ